MNIDDRMILGPAFQGTFPTSAMFLFAHTEGEYENVRVSLVTPGMEKDAVDGMRLELCQHLRETFTTGARRWWIASVRMVFNAQAGIPEIVVSIRNRSFARADSYRYILDVAAAFVALSESQLKRRLFVIPGGHRLVPLDFRFAYNTLEVRLPPEVKLVHSFGGSTDVLGSPVEDACSLLRSNLKGLLIAMEQKFRSLIVTALPNGFHITIDFDDADMSDPVVLDYVKQEICRLVSKHGRYEGENERLLFCTPELRDRSHD